MHWCDRRTAIALLGRELEALGWKLYGWKEDRSDSMTDYFDPEHWQGLATKEGGFVVVVDCNHGDVERISHPGPALGLYLEAEYAERDVHLERGDRILFYSDGLYDSLPQDETRRDDPPDHFGRRRFCSHPAAAIGLYPWPMPARS